MKVLPGGGGIFKSAAVAVLRIERKLMSTGDICRVALERGLLQAKGKTPEATMASALYTDVKRKERNSIFTRCAASPLPPPSPRLTRHQSYGHRHTSPVWVVA